MQSKKKNPIIDQSQGIRLTERQFKAILMTDMLTGLCSSGEVSTKEEALERIPDIKECIENILEACILDPIIDPE